MTRDENPVGPAEDGYDQLDLVVAREELDALYEWLSQSPAGEDQEEHTA